jgi:hypothetical protein
MIEPLTTQMDPAVHEALGRFFGSHNARSVGTRELVETFVPGQPWLEMIKPRNHLLIGPRGAGKTHLLRMLSPKALSSWEHPEADTARATVDYTGVLILSDRHWHAQLNALVSNLDAELTLRIESAAMTVAVMNALIESARQRLDGHHQPLTLDADASRELWRSIAAVWGLPPAGSLRMLADHVSRQSQDLHRTVAMLSETGDRAPLHRLAIFGIDPHLAAEHFVERVNDFAGEPDRRWALLFDEVELASLHLRRYIEQLLRGASQRLLIKVSLSPYTDSGTTINTPLGGMAGHDFVPISLTYPEKESAYDFTVALMERRLSKLGISTPVRDLLGPSALDETEGSEYGGIDTYKALAERDSTFRDYLSEKGIDLDDLDSLTPERRAAWLRKPRGAISIREAYGFKRGGGRRSRQRPTPFTGTAGICAVLEGNARWIIGLTERLFEGDQGGGRVTVKVQADTIDRAADSYHNFLTMLPYPGPEPDKEDHPVELADTIGRYFSAYAVERPFRAEPPTTFRVPDGVKLEVQASLQTLLHAGALIHIPDSENQVAVGSPAGLRFRLAYLLAPTHPFPLRVSKEVSLDRILSDTSADQIELTAQNAQEVVVPDGDQLDGTVDDKDAG